MEADASSISGEAKYEILRSACLEEEVQVGDPFDHGPKEHGQEGEDVVFSGSNGVAHITLVDCPWAEPDPPRILPAHLSWCPLIQGCPWVSMWLQKGTAFKLSLYQEERVTRQDYSSEWLQVSECMSSKTHRAELRAAPETRPVARGICHACTASGSKASPS